MATLLIIDDDVALARLLGHVLRIEGYVTHEAHGARSGIDEFGRTAPDLVILDYVLPDGTGEYVLRRIRERSNVPVIMLSGNSDDGTVVRTLEDGADDYVTKPFQAPQLLARIRTALRRAGKGTAGRTADRLDRLVNGPVVMDVQRREVHCNGRRVSLTPIEFSLLQYLLVEAGRVLTFDQIIRHVWGFTGEGNESLVRVHMSRLRKKLDLGPGGEHVLKSYPRIGYGFTRAERLSA